MKNINKISIFVPGMVLMALALVFALGAFPTSAQADYSYGSNAYGCAHPYVYPNGYYYCPTPYAQPQPPVIQPVVQPVVYQQPVYQQPVYQQPVYQPVTASCYAANSSIQVGGSVQWVAYASGGTGQYGYSWNGTDGFTAQGQAVYKNYYNPGIKSASITVYSGGQTMVANCSNSVVVQDYIVYQQPYQPAYIPQQPIYNGYLSANNGLDIGCYSDPSVAGINQPTNWSAEVTGGAAPYTYSWSGTDNLTGNSASVIKFYTTSGVKSAIVSVTSADGKTGTKACSTTLAIRGPVRQTVAVAKVVPVAAAPAPAQPASAFFSLSGVPWGWVAVLVILVLFATVMYLLFNKPKM